VRAPEEKENFDDEKRGKNLKKSRGADGDPKPGGMPKKN